MSSVQTPTKVSNRASFLDKPVAGRTAGIVVLFALSLLLLLLSLPFFPWIILSSPGALFRSIGVTDYSKKNILGEYATLDSFLRAWNSDEKKQAIIDELQERGVLLEALREASGNMDIDDFDLICHIAYDKAPLTKAERANNVRKRGYLYKYSGLAQEVLSALLDKYMNEGIQDIENLEILSNDPFRKLGTPMKIAKLFGGKNGYIQAIRDLQKEIYAA